MKKIETMSVGIFVAAMTIGASANAALPAAATDALDSITTGVADVEAGVWPVVGAALVAGILIKLVKRFANKI